MCIWKIFPLFLLICLGVWSQPAVIDLRGHLDSKRIEEAQELVASFREATPESVVLHINSGSGELRPSLDLARDLYELRVQNGVKIIAYLEDIAVGPAALFPFLADQLYASHFVSWGDISLGQEGVYPVNLLRSRVRGLIPPEHPHGTLLNLLAEAMVDEDLLLVDADGWRVAREAEPGGHVVSGAGERLVVDQKQLAALGLIATPMSPAEFHRLFEPEVLPAEEQAVVAEPIPESELDLELAKYIQYDLEGPNRVGHLEIKGPIDRSTWILIKAATDHFKKEKPAFLILELNTPGGEVFASQQISDALKDLDARHGLPTVCYINNWAISAGAMLAYSCRFIAIAKDAAMGAAEPVLQTGEGITPAAEKVSSALRADFANRAAFFGRNPLLAEAMVDKDVILVIRHGKIIKLDNEDQIITRGPYPDQLLSAKGKLLTLNARQLLDLGVADFQALPPPGVEVSRSELSAGSWPAGKSAIFQYPFFKAIPNATIEAYQMDWRTSFFSFLANPIVASILFLGMMLGAYIEFNTPGFGVAGTIALVCLFLIVLSSFSMEAAHWLELILLLIGLVLLALEIFVLPGFGIAGVLGIIFALAGILAMLLPGLGQVDFDVDSGTLNAAAEQVLIRLAWLGGAVIVGVAIMIVLGRFVMPKFSRFSRLISKGEQEAALGYVAGPDIRELPQVGREGEAVTPLRPAGKVLIDDHLFDAVSTGEYIDAGALIAVQRYEGSRMFVSAVRGGDL